MFNLSSASMRRLSQRILPVGAIGVTFLLFASDASHANPAELRNDASRDTEHSLDLISPVAGIDLLSSPVVRATTTITEPLPKSSGSSNIRTI